MLSIPKHRSLMGMAAGLVLLAGCRGPAFDGNTDFGGWKGAVQVNSQLWQPGQTVTIRANLQVTKGHFERMEAAGCPVERVVALFTAERTFDADGWMRLATDQQMSTLLTPTGLAIEGGISGAVTDRFGNYLWRRLRGDPPGGGIEIHSAPWALVSAAASRRSSWW